MLKYVVVNFVFLRVWLRCSRLCSKTSKSGRGYSNL